MKWKQWLRRLRGALGLATFWAVTWFVGFMGIAVFTGLFGAFSFSQIVIMGLGFARTGFITGAVFSGVLAYRYRDRAISDIATGGFVVAGAIVAALLSPGLGLIAALFGAASAGASLKLARGGGRVGSGDSTPLLDEPYSGSAADEAL